MPGIFGIISKEKNKSDTLKIQFARMAKFLRHFDYYAVERFETDNFMLGRIGIPFRNYRSIRHDNNTNRGVVFDGYLYGWHGAAKQENAHLKEPISLIPLDSVTEPKAIPNSINGSFTVALFESDSENFILANDKLGYRQLYYYQDDKLIAFAPEIKAFLGIDSFKAELDLDAVADYFNYGFVIGGRTFYRGVSLLYPASFIEVKDREIRSIQHYWKCKFNEELDGNENDLMKEMLNTAKDTLNRQMGQHEHFIMALSGGMDSRVVAQFASQTKRHWLYYSHGLKSSEDALIAKKVAKVLHIKDSYFHKDGNPECYSKYGAWTAWIIDGMVDLNCCFLTSVLNSYNKDPLKYEFQNTIYTGAMNFACAYGKAADIKSDLSLDQKIARIKQVLDSQYYNDSYYQLFNAKYGVPFRQSYDTHLINEFQRHQNISRNFVNQMDSFFLESRVLRLSNQYDLNRFFYHDHFSLMDDESFKLYLTLPMKFKVDRMLYKKMYQNLLPLMAKITYQKTGVDLYSEPSKLSLRIRALKDQYQYYIDRISKGRVNLYNYHNYTQPNQWYRQFDSNRRFYENILLDGRTLNRGFFNEKAVKLLLRQQALGSSNFNTISSLATFELFNRYFIDKEDPPKLER